MLTQPVITCPICRAETSLHGECWACLLRVGLDTASDPDRPESIPAFFGEFEIARREDGSLWELGRGGMGVTYRATDSVLRRVVALKVIGTPDGLTQSAALRERFLREARGAASLRHPNVAEIFQFGTSPETDHVYYTMELIDGETLEERVRRDGPVTEADALEMAIQVARALVAAAGRGLVHRDLKPGNIMLTRDGAAGALHATVIDFGLAKAMTVAENETRLTDGGFLGTPAFASPEQFRGEPADARADIYSLGVTLWYALTGHAPFTGRTLDELRDHPARAALPIKQLTARKVSAPVAALLRAALAVDPAARPASARELLAALEACRRRRGVRLAGAALAVLLLAAGVVSGVRGRPPAVPAVNPAPTTLMDKSIAVLPFDNFSEDKDSAFFASGVQDEVLTDLSKIADLKVISRASVMQYKDTSARNLRQISRALGAVHFVEGSVQRSGNNVRVTAQLIDGRTDTHEWAEQYDGSLTDIFKIQREIARRIADQLRSRLSPGEKALMAKQPTENMEAYRCYVEASVINPFDDQLSAERSLARKVQRLEEAIRLDPGFALAYCALARAQTDFEYLVGGGTHLALAKTAADAALRLYPDLGEAHREMAGYYYYAKDSVRVLDELAAARRQLPNDPEVFRISGNIAAVQNHWDAAVADLHKAHSLDPRNMDIVNDLASVYESLRDYRGWEQLLVSFPLDTAPQGYWIQVGRANIKLDAGDPKAAQAILDKVPFDFNTTDNIWFIRLNAALYLRDFEAAKRVIAATPAQSPSFVFNGVYDGDPPLSWADGLIARLQGNEVQAMAAFAAARAHADAVLGDHPRDAWYDSQVSLLDAELGRKDEAIREARAAADATPVSQDALYGPWFARNLALVYARTGEHDAAIQQLETLAKIPSLLSYGDLRFNPLWDGLRGDPRFEAMVTFLTPK